LILIKVIRRHKKTTNPMQLMKFVAFLTIYFREQRRTTIKHELIVKHKNAKWDKWVK
jgi:hypothetical protein